MCGIYFSTKFYPKNIIKEKLDRINFRGPDFSQSVTLDNQITLGHNRLAIIDLEQRSNQPFKYEHIWIVFNGEIYNYRSLRIVLQSHGFMFHTSSDTEVICAAYILYKENCLKHLNGMFSFVIYDSKENRIFAAKDRLGKKPFFYRVHDFTFECASQPSQIAIANNLSINDQVIKYLFAYRYIPSPNSIYKDVYKLPGGHYLTYTPGDKNISIHKYWDLNYEETFAYTRSYEDAKAELDELLTDAVNIRLMSDVPIGTFLSGGIDSTLVSSFVKRLSGEKNVRTFSVKFNEDKYDESQYATAIAKHLGTDHTNIECNAADGIELIEQLPRFYDEPFADSSAIPSMLLAKATRKFITVALSGDGGDEGFLGYNYFDWINNNKKFYKVPYFLRYTLGSILKLSNEKKLSKVGTLLKHKNTDWMAKKVFETQADIFRNDNSYEFTSAPLDSIERAKYDILQKAADVNIKLWLENDSNVKVDRASMSSSLEVRSPLLDYRIIEFARTLPISYRFQGGIKKRILKDILYENVPKVLLDRPKSGFTMPFEMWFRTHLKDYVYDKLTLSNLRSIPDLDADYIVRNIDKHMAGKKNFYPTIWSLIVFFNWKQYNNITL